MAISACFAMVYDREKFFVLKVFYAQQTQQAQQAQQIGKFCLVDKKRQYDQISTLWIKKDTLIKNRQSGQKSTLPRISAAHSI